MAKDPTKPGEKKRNTFYFDTDLMKKTKFIGLMEDKTQTDIIHEALTKYIAEYEKKNGPIKTSK